MQLALYPVIYNRGTSSPSSCLAFHRMIGKKSTYSESLGLKVFDYIVIVAIFLV